jgi:hypothetical protein
MTDFFTNLISALLGVAITLMLEALVFDPLIMSSPLAPETYELAAKKCDNNSGLKELSYNRKGLIIATCKNGAKFEFYKKD